MSKRKWLIISNDALVREDLDYLMTKPMFRELAARGSVVETLRTVYPSITYCCHASMLTGCYPDKTHVYNNEVDAWGDNNWVWERKFNRAKTLIDAAKEAGMTTANVFWPVLCNDPNVDYNVPEYWSQTKDEKDDPLPGALKRMGASDKVIEEIVTPNLYYVVGHQRTAPYADEFICACVRDMILKYNPDFMVVHPCNMDGARHKHGVFSDWGKEELDYICYWLKKIVRALKEIGEFENTNIILTSDHGQMDIKRWCHPNVLLVENGFIKLDKEGTVKSMKAYVKSVGCSAQVFLTDKKDKKTREAVYKLFTEAAESQLYGIEKCFTREEIAELEHLDGDFDFVLESDGYTAFGGKYQGKYFKGCDTSDYRTGRGTHGYLPDKGPQPCMVMIGPDFKAGVRIPRRSTLDMAATIAHIAGFNMPDMDGQVIEEVLVNP